MLSIDWHLTIDDYKEKKKGLQHATTLNVKTRSVLYDSLDDLKGDLEFIKSHFGQDLFSNFPPRDKRLKIFEHLPPPNQDTFDHGLLLVAKDDYVDVIIMYAPSLESLGSIDNSGSPAQASYSKSVTSGFTFSMSQKIGVETELEAGVVIAKGSFTMSMELSFTEQWNSSQTETVSFSVPAGEKAFTYQGYLLSRKLRFSPVDGFNYVDNEGRFLTNVIKTTPEPIKDL